MNRGAVFSACALMLTAVAACDSRGGSPATEAAAADPVVQQLEAHFAGSEPPKRRFVLTRIAYAPGEYELPPNAAPLMAKVGRVLAAHPEAWTVPPRERRAIRRARSQRRLRLRPASRRVAGAAMRAVRLPRNSSDLVRGTRALRDRDQLRDRSGGSGVGGSGASTSGPNQRRRSWRRIGIRRR